MVQQRNDQRWCDVDMDMMLMSIWCWYDMICWCELAISWCDANIGWSSHVDVDAGDKEMVIMTVSDIVDIEMVML